MAAPPMDPQYEQRLRDEVIYLHSLWHRGPPRGGAAPAEAAASTSAPAIRHHLQPSKATQFKKEKKRGGISGKKSTNKPNDTTSESHSSPGVEWPCPAPQPPPPTTGWPALESKPDPKPLPLSPEEQLKLAAKHAHKNALKVVHDFFRSNNDSDSDAIESSSDEDDELMEEDDGREDYGFFFKLFKEDNELREFYEKNFVKGEFGCLVCGALGGKKMGKKFKGCLALVQHSISIAKTKKRRAHRAFGRAVCKVLGWDIDQLPTIVSSLSDKSSDIQGDVNGDNKESSLTFVNNVDSLEGNNDEALPESGSNGAGIVPNGDEGDMNSSMCPHADKNLENLGMVHPHNMEEPAAERLTSNSLMGPDDDLSMAYPQSMEEPSTDGLTSNSLACLNADKNLENVDTVHPHNVEEPAAAEVPAHENNVAGDEMQDLEMGNAVHNGLNEDNELQNRESAVVTREEGTS